MQNYNTPQMELEEQRKRENQKWYAGDAPTRGETLAQIGKLYHQDRDKAAQAYKSFLTLSQDPSSAMYSPYMSATNTNTRQSLARYGVDTSNINDAWFESNAWMKQHNRVGSTGNVLGTAKSATDAQNMASLYADLYDQEQTTKKAETEWAALQDEVRYWASRADLNMSDDEILAKVNWGNYPTLSKMDAAATSGAPVYTTRAVGYDKDLLKGVIYQTRNNGGSGDLLMDSAHYYSGMGNQYVPDEATRARFTYGSDSYNPYVVSGTINDLGLYFGEGSFDRTWLEKNADILNGTNETAKKNYHKVQDAVALTEKANDELAKLNADIDRLVGIGVSADNIMGTIDRYLEDGTYPTLNKLHGSIETGELMNTASAISFDLNDLRKSVEERVTAKGVTGAAANEAAGIALIQDEGTEEEKAFFASMSALDYEDQVAQMWTLLDTGDMEIDADFLARSYQTLSDSFNAKWANQADDVMAGYAKNQEAVRAYFDAELAIERSPEYKRLQELGYTGEVDDYVGVNAFLETIDEAEYDAIWENLHDMYSDLAQADYTQDWNYMGGEIGRAYRDDYSALEAFRRRAQIGENASFVPLLEQGEEYSITDTAGLTADKIVEEVVAANEGVSSADAAAHVQKFYTEEKARLEKDIATLEKSGYTGKTLDNKRNKLAATERILGDVELHNLQYEEGYAEKAAEGAGLVEVKPFDFHQATMLNRFAYDVSDDGKVTISNTLDMYMKPAEKERLQYLAATDPAAAREYLATLTDDTYGVIPVRFSQEATGKVREMASESPVLSTLASIGMAPMQVAGTAYSIAQGARGREINPHSKYFSFTSSVGAIRSQVNEDIDEATKDSPVINFLAKVMYNAATSGADSIVSGTLGKAGLALMVSSGASATVQSAIERGASVPEALALGAVTGIIEYATEKIPFNALTDAMKGGKKAAGNFFKKLLGVAKQANKTGAQDAVGEGLSELFGKVADEWIMQDKSEHAIKVKQYMADHGVSKDDAEVAVFRDEMIDIASATVSGYFSSAGSVAAVGTGNVIRDNNERVAFSEEPAAEPQRDIKLAKKTAALEAVALSGNPGSSTITASLMAEQDATSTIAKAVTLEAQRIFGDNTASTLSGIYGAAYDAGVSDAEITSALKKSLAPGNADGKVQLQELTQDGASTGKIKTFVQNMQNAPEFTHADAREVLINEQQRVIFEESTTCESLRSALKVESNAKNAYTKAQQVVGKIKLQQSASVKEMNKAMTAYNESLTNPNGNTQTAIQHAYMIAIDNVANFNSALEAANRRMQEAKEKYDAAISNYKEVSKRILADVRAKAEKAVDQALMEAENKTVSELSSAAKPVTDTAVDGEPKRDDSEIRNAVIEEMREAGLLDELTDINRQIAEYEQKLAGSHKKNSLSKAIRRAKDHLVRKRAELSSVVDELVAQEVARIETTQPETQSMKTEFVETVSELVSEEDVQVSGVDPVDLKKMQEAYVTTLRDYKQARADAEAAMNDADDPDNPFHIYDENEVNRIAAPFEEKFQSALSDLMDIAPKLNPIALKNLPVKGQLVWGNNTIEEDGTVYRYALIDKAEIKGTEYEKITRPRTIGETSDGVYIDSTEPSVFEVSPEGEVVEGFWFNKVASQNKYGSDKLKKRASYYGFNPNDMRADRVLMKIPLSAETARGYKAQKSIDPVETQPEVQPEAGAKVMAESTGINRDADTATIPMTQETQDTYTSDGDDYDALLEKYGAIEQGENPVSDRAIPKQIDDERAVSRGVRTYAEAYTTDMVSDEEVQRLVLSGEPTYTKQKNVEQVAKAKAIVANRGIDGALAIWESAVESGRLPTSDEMVLGQVLLNDAVQRRDQAAKDKLAAQFAVMATGLGQSMQSINALKRLLAGSSGMYYLQLTENRLNSELAKKGRSVKLNPQLVKAYGEAKTDAEREKIADNIKADLAQQIPYTIKEFANAWRYMSMLSSTKTPIANIAGNVANVPLVLAKDTAGAFIDRFRAVENRTHSAIIKQEYLDFAKDYIKANKSTPDGSRYTVSTGEIKSLRKPFGNAELLNKAYGKIAGAMEWGDAKFKSLYYPRILAGYLQAKKVDLANVSSDLLAKADAYAQEQTLKHVYQDNNAVVLAARKLTNMKYVGPIFNAIQPFTKTPINIAKTAIEYHPVGAAINAIYQGNKNGWSSEQVVDAAAKGLAGCLPVLLGYALRMAGVLTTSLGDDPEDKLAKQHGSQAYALEWGGKSFSLSWMGPMSMLMNFGASIADACDGEFTVDDISGVGMGTLEVLTDLSLLSGLVDLFEITQYVEGDTPTEKAIDFVGEAAMQIAGGYAGSYVPAILGSIARTVDPVRRSTTTNPESAIPESLQYQLYRIRNKIPGLSDNAPAYTDEFGRTETDSHARAFLENFVLPGYVNDLKTDDPVLNAVTEVYNLTGIAGVIPEKASKSFTESNAKHKMSGDDYARMNEQRGNIIYDTLSEMVKTEEWANTDALIRADMIKAVYNYADNASRVGYVTMSPFSEAWQKEAYERDGAASAILGRAEKYAQTAYGELYANELLDSAANGDWEDVANKWAHLTTAYPYGAGLSGKQASNRIESELKTKLQEGDAEITPEEYDAVMQLYALGMIDSTLVDELMAQ